MTTGRVLAGADVVEADVVEADVVEADVGPGRALRRSSGERGGWFSTAVLAAGLITAALVWIRRTSKVVDFSDTPAYFDPSASFSDLIDPFGGGRRPGLLTPLLFRAAGSLEGAAWIQTVFAAVCWSLLAGAVAAGVGRLRSSVVSVGLVVLIATSPLVATWNQSVLSESVAISTIALFAAAVVVALTRLRGPSGALLVAGALVVVALGRPMITVVLFPLAALIVWSQARPRRKMGSVRLGAWLLVVLAVGFTGVSTLLNARQEYSAGLTFTGWYAYTREVDFGTVGALTQIDTERPQCAQFEAVLAEGRTPGKGLVPSTYGDAMGACPELVEWFNEGGTSLVDAARVAPRSFLLLLIRNLRDILTPTVFFRWNSPIDPLVQVAAPESPTMVLVVALFVAMRCAGTVRRFRGPRWAEPALVAMCGGASLLLVSLDGLERGRHGVPFVVIGCVAAALYPTFGRRSIIDVRSAADPKPVSTNR